MLDRILTIFTMMQSVYSRWLFRQLISSLIVTAALIVVTSVMFGAILVGGFYAAYQILLHYGVDTLDAQLIIAAAVLLGTLVLSLITLSHVRCLLAMPHKFMHKRAPQIPNNVVNAFLAGFFEPQRK